MIPRARWQQIQSLFEQLADVPGAERAAQLERSCGNDVDLRQSVESLLDLDQNRKDPLLHAIGAAAESLLEDHRDRLIGTRVGPYRIVSILGHGGMSIVYRGERDDSQYQQSVAIKVLQHATLHPQLRNRLHSERHILATLDHPCIARLIDSGDLEDGTPYLVMEHVDGQAIDQFCDSRTLFIRERLELFVEVCAAVHYAQVLELINAQEDPYAYSYVLIANGTASWASGDVDTALRRFGEALEVARKIQNPSVQGRALYNIGLIYDTIGDSDLALDFYPQALPFRSAESEGPGRVATLSAIANTLFMRGETAEALKMDPLEFRLKNAAKEGTKAAHGPTFPRIGFIETLEAAKNSDHYKAPLGKLQGRGVASGFWFNAGGESSAQVNITEDGNVVVTTGHPDIGGSRAGIANICAELLGIDYKRVSVIIGDTQTVGFSNLTGGSRVLFASSIVVTQSTETIINTLRQRAAKIWDIDPDAVKWENGAAHPVSPNAGQFEPLTLKELAEKAPAMGGPIGARKGTRPITSGCPRRSSSAATGRTAIGSISARPNCCAALRKCCFASWRE